MTISSPYRTGSMRNTVFYGHGAVHEMGPRATGQVAQSEVAQSEVARCSTGGSPRRLAKVELL